MRTKNIDQNNFFWISFNSKLLKVSLIFWNIIISLKFSIFISIISLFATIQIGDIIQVIVYFANYIIFIKNKSFNKYISSTKYTNSTKYINFIQYTCYINTYA